jgi:beta-lactamase class A
MRKITVVEKTAYSVALAMTALFICTAILAAVMLSSLKKTESKFSEYRTDAEIKLSELEKKRNEMKAEVSELENKIKVAEKTRAELEMKIGQTEKELEELESSFENTDELYKTLNDRLSSLKAELNTKNAEIEALKNDVKELSKAYGADLNRQYELMSELVSLLASPPEEGSVSVYYKDLERGHTFKSNESLSYPTANCIAVPFALSVLDAASEEKKEYNRLLSEYQVSNPNATELPDYTFKYGLNNIFIYTEDKAVNGSGVIKDSDFGTEFSYYELFELYLKYNDSVAEKELTSIFGTTLRNTLLKNIGTSIMKTDPQSTTASDLALIIEELYEFSESGAEYASLIRKAMSESVHNVMICGGITDKEVLHQHGWSEGAYHDMALVYDEHPYVLVIATDLDNGGDAVNAYIQRIASLIDDIHESFYD